MSGQQITNSGSNRVRRSRVGLVNGQRELEPVERTPGYVDVALFFLGVLLLSTVSRAAVHVGLLPTDALNQPPLLLQVAVSLLLALDQYLVIRFRHGPPVWSFLGWTRLRWSSLLSATIGGATLALLVDVVAHATTQGSYPIHFWQIVLLDVTLGPIVEESFFRGCLQPAISHSAGNTVGVIATAVIFASSHPVSTLIEWMCLLGTGIVYGWIRAKTRSTSTAAFMHAAYNLTLFLCQFR